MNKWICRNAALRVAGTLAVAALPLGSVLAQGTGGCVDSPENPTLLLGLLGAAVAGAPRLKSYIATRRKR
jgi:XrtJ-associated TM-motif-TM protein